MAKVLFAQPNAGWQWEALTEACGLNSIALYPANRCEDAEDMSSELDLEVVVGALNFPDGDWRRVLQLGGRPECPTASLW